jgi:vacuolar-type H+-ATPase subunit H
MTAPTGGEGAEGEGSEGSDGSEGAEDTGDGEGEDTGPKTLADLLATLPEDQQAMVRKEMDHRDKEMRKARQEARNLRTRAQDAEAKAAAVDDAQNGKQAAEQKADEVVTTARRENEALRRRLVAQEIKVVAAGMNFADPEDPAAALADQVADLMDDDLEPDTQAITDALTDLLERKPHWAKQQEAAKPRPPAPSKAQGSSGSPSGTPGSRGLAEAQRRYGAQKQTA